MLGFSAILAVVFRHTKGGSATPITMLIVFLVAIGLGFIFRVLKRK
jgi:hypothetical protein